MSKSNLHETIGFLGVVASLIFVGAEIRQNTTVARGQARQALAEINDDWLSHLTTDVVYSDLWYRAWEVEGDVAEGEVYRAGMMMTQFVRRLENVYFQYKEGLVDETALRSYGLQNFEALFEFPRFQEWWIDGGWRSGFHPDFVAFVEARASSGD
ncbi:MAG: hypothetical protein ACC682_16360 [Gemmatimonadota bacterium]